MSNYWLFGGDKYYPLGGAHDILGLFDTYIEALEHAARCKKEWWHIYCMERSAIISTSENMSTHAFTPTKKGDGNQ